MYSRLCYGKRDYPFNYCEFICDSISDLADLPTNEDMGTGRDKAKCAIGSKAHVLQNKKMYILNNSNEWVEYVDYNAKIEVATVAEATSYLSI